MRDDLHSWQEEGISVALIGSGSASFASAFAEDFDLDLPLYVDPSLDSFRAAGLRRGVSAVASPRFFTNALRAYQSGARQQGVEGDPWQLGGVLVIAAGGDLLGAFRSETAGDHASPEEIEAALRRKAPIEEGIEAESRNPLSPLVDGLRPVLDLSPVGSFDRIGYARHAIGFDVTDLDVDLFGQTCLVTGANSGIGFESASALADLGADVRLLCRNQSRGEKAAESIRNATGNARVSCLRVDMSNFADIDRVLDTLGDEPIDVLIHNAGVLPDARAFTAQELETTFATHIAGPHRLTAGLHKNLAAADSARVIWVSSGGMLTRQLQVEDPNWLNRPYDGVVAYAETKRAQVVLAELWAEEWAGTDIVSNSMHPGWADTPSVRESLPRFHEVTKAILRTPREGADTVIWLAAAADGGEISGKFFFDRQPVRTHWLPTTRESQLDRDQLWKMCREFERG